MPKLALVTFLAIICFAANSVINRMAIAGGHVDALDFGSLRLVFGAAVLLVLMLVLRKRSFRVSGSSLVGVASLLFYIYGFTLAYDSLDAGLGALVLFGVVQLTMFSCALLKREPVRPAQWAGAALAFAGLAYLLWPDTGVSVSLTHAGFMAIAGLGWGVYSLKGKKSKDAFGDTLTNFVLATPFAILIFGLSRVGDSATISATGWVLAFLGGAITSGVGYAMWYSVLPKMASSTAAVLQLTVPLIATLGGILLLGEVWTMKYAIATVLVLAGVTLTSVKVQR